MEPDPLQEVREIRRKIAVECGDEPEKVFDYYTAYQDKMRATGKFKFVTEPVPCVSAGGAKEQLDEQAPN